MLAKLNKTTQPASNGQKRNPNNVMGGRIVRLILKMGAWRNFTNAEHIQSSY